MSVLFNQTCSKEKMLPRYTFVEKCTFYIRIHLNIFSQCVLSKGACVCISFEISKHTEFARNRVTKLKTN